MGGVILLCLFFPPIIPFVLIGWMLSEKAKTDRENHNYNRLKIVPPVKYPWPDSQNIKEKTK